MHTNSEPNPWWTLDLAAVVRIQKVYLTLNLLIKPWPIKILGDAPSTRNHDNLQSDSFFRNNDFRE